MTNGEWIAQNKRFYKDIKVTKGAAPGLYKITDRSGITINSTGKNSAHALANWLDMERKEPILDCKEKEFLKFVIRPFRDRVKEIVKRPICAGEYIAIVILGGSEMRFPDFDTGSMYKGMRPNHKYTLEELGL